MKSDEKERRTPVAIIGIGAMFPGASNLKGYWRLLFHGQDAITDVPESHWSAGDYFDPDPKAPDRVYCTRGGFLSAVPFDPTEFGLPPAILEATDTSQLLGLVTAKMALEDAGYGDGVDFNRERTSVILGVTGTQELVIPLGARLGHPLWRRALQEAGVSSEKTETVIRRIADRYVSWQENSFPGLLGNVVAGRICNRLDLGGTNCVVDAACASSMSAIHLALMELDAGRSDMVLSGGVDTLNDIFMHMCFSRTGVLSPTGEARPFSADADGTVLGEGIGIFALKRLEDARKDGDRIYAVVRAVGTASDGRSQSIYAPRAQGQARALRRAYEAAGIDPRTVGLVEAHGTGTRVGDGVEFTALKEVLDPDRGGTACAVGSVKSMIGHTKAAAGSAGLIKAALALYHKVLPPTLKADPVDPKLDIDRSRFFLPAAARPWFGTDAHPRRAGVSAFGFGGSNYHAVLEEAGAEKPETAWDGACEILAFSGTDPGAIRRETTAFCDRFAAGPVSEAALSREAAALRSRFSASDPWRLLAVVDPAGNRGTWIDGIRSTAAGLGTDPQRAPAAGGDVFVGGPAPDGDLAVLFPGQGSQYTDMGCDLVCQFSEALRMVEMVCRAGDGHLSLETLLYPKRVDGGSTDRLQPTDVAQPAIGAVSLAMWRVLAGFGVSPAAFSGHSFGELTALCAAGWLVPEGFAELAWTRGRLMAAAGAGKDPGAMLAVRAPLSDIEALLAEPSSDLVLANRNAPDQGVLSGTAEALEAADQECRRRGWKTVRLPVAAAFHSRRVAAAADPFSHAVARVGLAPGPVPVYSNTTAAPYPADARKAERLLGEHLARPVDFTGQIEALYRAGCRTFLEVGPGRVLSGLARATLSGKRAAFLSMDASGGSNRGSIDLARTLSRLAALGHPVDLTRWEAPAASFRPPKMEILLSGANLQTSRRPAAAQGVSFEKKPPFRENAAMKNTEAGGNGRRAPFQADENPMPRTEHLQQAVESPMKSDDQSNPGKSRPVNLSDALRVVEEGIRSMQALQEQTARAHEKFLDLQTEAARNLQRIMDGTRALAAGDLSAPAPPREPAPEADPPAPVSGIEKEATPAAPPAAAPEPPAPDSSGVVKETLVSVVSELTGYPPEMIGPDMDIEADLGIDSIKRVEILSTVEERMPGLPQVTPEMMGTLRTLDQIAAFLSGNSSSPEPAVEEPAAPASEPEPPAKAPMLVRRTVTLQDCPRPDSAPPELPAGRKIYVTRDESGLADALCAALASSGLASKSFSLAEPPPDFSDAAGLVVVSGGPLEGGAALLRSALLAAAGAGRSLEASAESGAAVFATVTRLDGALGFARGPGFDPLSGGLFGLAKCAAVEWPKVSCRAIDVDPDWKDDDAVAAEIAAELFRTGGDIEVGLSENRRAVPVLRTLPAGDENPEVPDFSPEDVVLITGGARGVTAEAAVALARSVRPTLILLGRSPAPEAEPAWLRSLEAPSDIKKAILAHHFSGRTPSPSELEAKYGEIAAAREIARNLARIEQAGARVRYYTGDVRDPAMLDSILEEVRTFYGPVTAVIHGAGVLDDRLIVDKTGEQFDRVFSTKVDGLLSVLAATGKDPVRAIILFSSVAARFGNRGQADYAMANEVLNKIAQKEAGERPGCRVVSINWGPWDGGMVTPALKGEFHRRGIELISPDAGAGLLVQEMALPPGGPVEVVVGAAIAEKMDPASAPVAGGLSLTLRRELDVKGFPVLSSHILDGKPVVPFALMADWLGHGALKENPGMTLFGLDDIRVLKGIRLDTEKRLVRLMAGKAVREGDLFLADVEIRDGVREGREVVHYRARAVLCREPFRPPDAAVPDFPDEAPYRKSVEDVYREILFHGSHLQGIRRIIGFSAGGMRAELSPAPAPDQWMADPPFDRWSLDPLVLDSAFQMSIVWSVECFGQPSLPSYAASYRQYRERFPESGVVAVMDIRETSRSRMKGDFTFLDADGALIARLSGYEAVVDPALTRSFRPEGADEGISCSNG